ncbi:cobaltochelatase CobT-related protein [Shinella sp.]|uniref:cobaltochelatase CobT-related protein n=1 Tax=Shinella sp. TaxID=1870904 RepID=UPI003F71948F
MLKLLSKLSKRRSKPENGYRVYTREFDQTVDQADLDRIIGPLSLEEKIELEEAWRVFEHALSSWRISANLHALEKAAGILAALSPAQRQDTTVSLLIDHSGSMKGQSILLAAAAAEIAYEFLTRLGCSVEVLGFTTTTWKGGLSRKKWLSLGAQPQPGRLCDVLHIIYRSADQFISPVIGLSLKNMLRRDLLKENVDGEAIEWAAHRLSGRKEAHRVLLVLSDGVPMDDSTAQANGESYLLGHLKSVLARLDKDSSICVGSVGLRFDVQALYSNGIVVEGTDNLAIGMIDMVSDLLRKSHER